MTRRWVQYLPRLLRQRIEGRSALLEVLDNTGWMMGDQVLRQIVGLVVGVSLARYLGPKLFGELSYAYAVLMIVSPLAVLALDEISIRRMAQDPSCREDVVGTTFVLMVAGGLIASTFGIVGVVLARPGDRIVQWLVGILVAGTAPQAFNAIEFWFESQMRGKFTVCAKTSGFLLISAVKIGLILLGAPLIAFALAGFAETVVAATGLLIVYRIQGHALKVSRFRLGAAASLLRDSWPLILSAVSSMIYLRIDQVMLGNMVGNEELGNYSVAVRISEVWNFIPVVICSAVFPAIMRARSSSEELFSKQMQKLYGLMALIAYCIALPVAVMSKTLVRVLFSSVYADAAPLLAVLVWTGVFTSLGAARNVFIVAKNWTRINLVSTALGCLLNIFLNYILIPRYGAMGAVIATFISYWFAVHGTCLFLRPLHDTGWKMTKAMLCPKFW